MPSLHFSFLMRILRFSPLYVAASAVSAIAVSKMGFSVYSGVCTVAIPLLISMDQNGSVPAQSQLIVAGTADLATAEADCSVVAAEGLFWQETAENSIAKAEKK